MRRTNEAVLVECFLVDISLVTIEDGYAVVGRRVAEESVLHGHRIVIGNENHVTHIELPVGVGVRQVRQVLNLVAQAQREVHFAGVGGSVGKECDIVLVKSEISLVAKPLYNQFAFGIEFVVIEKRICLNGEVGGVAENYVSKTVIVDVVIDRPDAVRLVESDVVSDLSFFLFRPQGHIAGDGVFQKSFVNESSLQLVDTCHGECRIVDYRWRSHPLNPFVKPVCGVFSRQVVDCQLHFEASKHFVVFGLPEVVYEFLGRDVIDVFLVDDVDFCLVEKELAVGDVFC